MPSWLLILLEVVCVGLVVAGLALIYVPAAFIVAGLAGVLVCERWSPALAARSAGERP